MHSALHHMSLVILFVASEANLSPATDMFSNLFRQTLTHLLHVGSQRSQRCLWLTGRLSAVVLDLISVKGSDSSVAICVSKW